MNTQESITPKGFLFKKTDLGKWKATFDYPDDRLCNELKFLKKAYNRKPSIAIDDSEYLVCRPPISINLSKILTDFSIKFTIIE